MSTLENFVALLRGAHVAALVSLFGTLLFLVVVAQPAMAEAVTAAARVRLVLLRLARISAACGLIVGFAWLTLESAVIAGADSASMTLHVLPVVALQTQFGQWLTVRLGLLLVVFSLLCAAPLATVAATVLAAATLAIQPMLGHAGAIGGGVGIELIISETLHLLAAGAWLGGLLPLFISLGILPHEQAATACRNFTPIGLAAVLILAGTAVVQVAEFMGGLPGLFGSRLWPCRPGEAWIVRRVAHACGTDRLVFTDRLAGTASLAARRHMRLSVATEAVLGVLVVITAGFLASHAPGTHEQPVWPFPWRPSLDALYEPLLQQEVITALIAAIGAVAIAVIGLLWRRIRWPALAASVIILVLAVPHLDLLFVEAFPTSFYTSPTEFAATAIVHGGKLFAANCTTCHGADGQGDGPAAQSLPIRPADLTAEHLWAHSDGEMYWYISHGFEAPQGGITMQASPVRFRARVAGT